MKKRSLLAVSLASLVSLVGCGKDGGVSSCSAKEYDTLTFAQFGVFYGGLMSETLPFGYEAYNFCKVSYEISTSISGQYLLDYYGLEEDYKETIKGSFEVVLDESSDWVVNPDVEYSDEQLGEIDFVLEEYCNFGYLSLYSWGYLYSQYQGWGAYLEESEEMAAEDDEWDFKASFNTAPGYSYTSKETYEYLDGEGEDAQLEERDIFLSKVSVEYNDLFGYMTKYESSDEASYQFFGEEPSKAKQSTKASLSFKYKAIIEEDEDDNGR